MDLPVAKGMYHLHMNMFQCLGEQFGEGLTEPQLLEKAVDAILSECCNGKDATLSDRAWVTLVLSKLRKKEKLDTGIGRQVEDLYDGIKKKLQAQKLAKAAGKGLGSEDEQ
jgi:hypothetical protein